MINFIHCTVGVTIHIISYQITYEGDHKEDLNFQPKISLENFETNTKTPCSLIIYH